MKAKTNLVILLGTIILVGGSCKKEEIIKPTSLSGCKSQVTEYKLLNLVRNELCDRPGTNCLPEVEIKNPKPLKLSGEPEAVAAYFCDKNIEEWSIYFPVLSSDPVALKKLQSKKYAMEKISDPKTPGRYIYCFRCIEESDYFGIPVIIL